MSRGSRSRAQVALTFHGPGDPAIATAALGALALAQAKVTVLAVGTWLDPNPALADAIIGGGHELGNHTWTHPDLAALSEAEVRAQIQRCRDTLIRLTGSPGAYFRQSSA